MVNMYLQEPVATVQVNLGDIPGRLVDLGRPPLPAGAKALAAAAAAASRQEPPPSPKDSTVMEHRVAGDLVLGKLNKSMKKSMARAKSRRKSDGSVKSRKSMANSDLQVWASLHRLFVHRLFVHGLFVHGLFSPCPMLYAIL